MYFKSVLSEYFSNIDRLKYDLERGTKSLEDIISQRYINLKWMHYILVQCFSDSDLFQEIKDEDILNKKEFELPESQRCPGCEDGKPYKIIKYRDYMIPVYDDDYGQQDFAVIGGKEVSGGCYNFYAEYEFMHALDRFLEQQFFDGKYDMKEELRKLYNIKDDDK